MQVGSERVQRSALLSVLLALPFAHPTKHSPRHIPPRRRPSFSPARPCMLSQTRTTRQYDIPVRGAYKVWLPTKNADSDVEREQRPRPATTTAPTATAAVAAVKPEPAHAPRAAQPIPRSSYSTTASSSSHPWYLNGGHAAPGQQPSNSSLSSAGSQIGSQKYSTPSTSLSSSFQQPAPKLQRIDVTDVPARPRSSWRSSGDRSIDDRPEGHSKRPSTGESTGSAASSGSATGARDPEQRRSDVMTPVRSEPTSQWFREKPGVQGSSSSLQAGRAAAPTDIFVPSEVQQARQSTLEKPGRKEEPRKPSGYLSDVTETGERTPRMLSRSPPAPVVFPMYPSDRGSKVSATVPVRGISPANVPVRGVSPMAVPPRGVSPSTAPRYDPRSRTNSQNEPSGVRSPYSWQRTQPSATFNNALPADDEVVVQKLQRTKSATSATPYPAAQPYAQAGKAEPMAIPTRRTTLPGSTARDSHSSSQSSLQFLAPSAHGSSTGVNNINGSRTSLTTSFSPPPARLPRVPSNSTVAQTTSMLPPIAHLRSPSQTALPPSGLTSATSTRPPTAQAASYSRPIASYSTAPTATNVLSPSMSAAHHLLPATAPYRSSFSTLPSSQASLGYPHAQSQIVANGSSHTQVYSPPPRTVAQTPYRGTATLPPSSQFDTVMRETSHLPTSQIVNAQLAPVRMQTPPHRIHTPPLRAQSPLQRVHTPPQRVQSPPHRLQSPVPRGQSPAPRVQTPQPSVDQHGDSTSEDVLPTPAAVKQARAGEHKKRGSGGGTFSLSSLFKPKRQSTDHEKEKEKEKEKELQRLKKVEHKSRPEKAQPKEPAKVVKQPPVLVRESGNVSSSRENVSVAQPREFGSSLAYRPTASSSHGHSRHSSTTSVRMDARMPEPTATTSKATAMAMAAAHGMTLGGANAVSIPNSGRRSPKMSLKLFQRRRERTVSLASVEALDGMTISTVMNSPASSVRSPTPGASPPQRDPKEATLVWRDLEERELIVSGRSRRRRPGVTFDIALEDSPMAGDKPRPSKTRNATPRSTPRPLPARLSDEEDDSDDSDDDDEDEE